MGETGIGKTSLIRLLSNITDFPIKIINIHAGVTSEEI
jgi:MoxR-like ATPase